MTGHPTIDLALLPTPLQHLPRLSRETGVEFWFKRDDLTGDLGLAGNKARKLEYLVGEAIALGATHLLTTGGPQSNHARATAAAAARLGLKAVLLLAGKPPAARVGNLLLDDLFGAEVRFPGAITPADQQRALEAAAADLERQGFRPYLIPVGGSTPLGTLGSYQCYREMLPHLPADAWLCCTTGSGGTHAGLALGAALHGGVKRVQAFSVWQSSDAIGPVTEHLAREAAQLLGQELPALTLQVDDGYLAPRYGQPSPAGNEAIRLLARLEGILLDPVYTGKAMAGVLDYIRRGIIGQGERVIFLHTGGAPALFAGLDSAQP